MVSDAFWIALIAAVPPTLLGIATLAQQIRTHKTFNSKMDTYIELAVDDALKRGAAEEVLRRAKEIAGGKN